MARKHKTARHDPRRSDARDRALHALAHMRREKLSLAEACRLEHIKPATFLRHVGSAVRQDRHGGRYRPTKGDRFRRDVQIPTATGPEPIPIYGSKAASEISEYLNAVALYGRTGDTSGLRQFEGKTFKSRGRTIELVTDPTVLTTLAEAEQLHIDQMYAAIMGAP